MTKILESDWSDWLDFNQETFSKIPEESGVFMMHAAMKILYIGGSENMKKTIIEKSTQECISQATRFRYKKEIDFEKNKEALIIDFKKRHEGKLPGCMN